MKSASEQRNSNVHPPCTVTDATGSKYEAEVLNPRILVVKVDQLELPIEVVLADGTPVPVADVAGPVSDRVHTGGRKVFAVRLAEAVGDDSSARRTPWICTVVPAFCR